MSRHLPLRTTKFASARAAKPDWEQPFETLRKKWVTVPVDTTGQRRSTEELLALPESELVDFWRAARDYDAVGERFGVRGWYRLLYRDFIQDKKVLDIGSGLGLDSVTFAEYGAEVVCADLVESNLEVIERVADAIGMGERVSVHYFSTPDDLAALANDFDVITGLGSLHNAPRSVMKPELAELVRHLKVGGRWLQLAYPRTRWESDGRPPFDRWAERCDGPGTPWEEWYDVPKLLDLLAPAIFDVVFYTEFYYGDFNWFDLVFKGIDTERVAHQTLARPRRRGLVGAARRLAHRATPWWLQSWSRS